MADSTQFLTLLAIVDVVLAALSLVIYIIVALSKQSIYRTAARIISLNMLLILLVFIPELLSSIMPRFVFCVCSLLTVMILSLFLLGAAILLNEWKMGRIINPFAKAGRDGSGPA